MISTQKAVKQHLLIYFFLFKLETRKLLNCLSLFVALLVGYQGNFHLVIFTIIFTYLIVSVWVLYGEVLNSLRI